MSASSVHVSVSGQLEWCEYYGADHLYCNVSWQHGQDWQQVSGQPQGATQLAAAAAGRLVWNFPLAASFAASNISGWPQLVLNVYGLDGVGRDVVRGYGAVHVPVVPGRHAVRVRLFAPQAASPLQRFTGWLSASQAEFVDPKFAARTTGRDVVRVTSNGVVHVVFNVATQNMAAAGYDVGVPLQQQSLFVAPAGAPQFGSAS